jgi:hypothetical protein
MVEDSEALYSRLLHGLPVHAGPNSK